MELSERGVRTSNYTCPAGTVASFQAAPALLWFIMSANTENVNTRGGLLTVSYRAAGMDVDAASASFIKLRGRKLLDPPETGVVVIVL